jgi:hypothetical protein
MGAAASQQKSNSPNPSSTLTARMAVLSLEKAVGIVMPMYYTALPLTMEEKDAALVPWKSILSNKCENFNRLKSTTPDFPHNICLDLFIANFHSRLFDVHPICKSLFRGKNTMFANIARMLNLFLDELDNETKLFKILDSLVNNHNKLGIKAIECKYPLNKISKKEIDCIYF